MGWGNLESIIFIYIKKLTYAAIAMLQLIVRSAQLINVFFAWHQS